MHLVVVQVEPLQAKVAAVHIASEHLQLMFQ